MLQRHIYNGFIIQTRTSRDRMSAKIHVIQQVSPDEERCLAGPFKSLDEAMHWIDSPLTNMHRREAM